MVSFYLLLRYFFWLLYHIHILPFSCHIYSEIMVSNYSTWNFQNLCCFNLKYIALAIVSSYSIGLSTTIIRPDTFIWIQTRNFTILCESFRWFLILCVRTTKSIEFLIFIYNAKSTLHLLLVDSYKSSFIPSLLLIIYCWLIVWWLQSYWV
jgi:hypothetical protein